MKCGWKMTLYQVKISNDQDDNFSQKAHFDGLVEVVFAVVFHSTFYQIVASPFISGQFMKFLWVIGLPFDWQKQCCLNIRTSHLSYIKHSLFGCYRLLDDPDPSKKAGRDIIRWSSLRRFMEFKFLNIFLSSMYVNILKLVIYTTKQRRVSYCLNVEMTTGSFFIFIILVRQQRLSHKSKKYSKPEVGNWQVDCSSFIGLGTGLGCPRNCDEIYGRAGF